MEKIISEIEAEKEDSGNGYKNEKRIISRYSTADSEIIRKAIINTQNLVIEILKIIKKKLETIKNLTYYYDKYIKKATEREWQFIFSEENQNDAFTNACKKLVMFKSCGMDGFQPEQTLC